VTGCKTGFTAVVRTLGNAVIAWANDTIHRSQISDALMKRLNG
jgi:hypothetical protein